MANHLLEAQETLLPTHDGDATVVQKRGEAAKSHAPVPSCSTPAEPIPTEPTPAAQLSSQREETVDHRTDTNTEAILTDLKHQNVAVASIQPIELHYPANTAAAALPSAALAGDVDEVTVDLMHLGPNTTAAPTDEATLASVNAIPAAYEGTEFKDRLRPRKPTVDPKPQGKTKRKAGSSSTAAPANKRRAQSTLAPSNSTTKEDKLAELEAREKELVSEVDEIAERVKDKLSKNIRMKEELADKRSYIQQTIDDADTAIAGFQRDMVGINRIMFGRLNTPNYNFDDKVERLEKTILQQQKGLTGIEKEMDKHRKDTANLVAQHRPLWDELCELRAEKRKF
jgi:uncharacterized protein YoxC